LRAAEPASIGPEIFRKSETPISFTQIVNNIGSSGYSLLEWFSVKIDK